MSRISSTERKQLLEHASQINQPAYIYFLKRLEKNFHSLRLALPSSIEILYSVKANPYSKILSALSKLGAGADVSSKGEIEKALSAGFSPSRIHFIGPGKSDAEISFSMQTKVKYLIVESLNECKRIDKIAKEQNLIQDIIVRINPLRYLNANNREVASSPSHFGIDEEVLPNTLSEIARFKHLRTVGFHTHFQSQFLDADTIIQNMETALESAIRLSRESQIPLKILGLGGGFGVPYFKGQNELDLQSLNTKLKLLLENIKIQIPEVQLFVESGRFLTANCGFYIARIIDRKVSRGTSYLVVEGGINHHQAAAGIGQPVKRNYPITLLNEKQDQSLETVSIVGPTCYVADIMARDVELPKSEIGDWICIELAGAYGPSFSPLGFLSRENPKEILIP